MNNKPSHVKSYKSCVSIPKQKLIESMQRINFGRIEEFIIRDGEPVLDPPPRIILSRKVGGENGARPESNATDFELKKDVRELFEQFEAIGNGKVRMVTIKHGLPFTYEIEESAN